MTVIGTAPTGAENVSVKLPSWPTITLRSFTSTVAPGSAVPSTVRFVPSMVSPLFGLLSASGGAVWSSTTVAVVEATVSVGVTSSTTSWFTPSARMSERAKWPFASIGTVVAAPPLRAIETLRSAARPNDGMRPCITSAASLVNCGVASSSGAAPTRPVVSATVRSPAGTASGMRFVTNEPNEPPARLMLSAAVPAISAALASTSPQTIAVAIGGSPRRARRCLAARAVAR